MLWKMVSYVSSLLLALTPNIKADMCVVACFAAGVVERKKKTERLGIKDNQTILVALALELLLVRVFLNTWRFSGQVGQIAAKLNMSSMTFLLCVGGIMGILVLEFSVEATSYLIWFLRKHISSELPNKIAEREKWIDIAKGFAMVGVVYSHTGTSQIGQAFVNSFDLPLFFIASGYLLFHRNTMKHSVRAFVIKQLVALIYPFLTFGVLMTVFQLMLGEGT